MWVSISTGQSLDTGYNGYGQIVVSTTSPYANIMLNYDGGSPLFPIEGGAGIAGWNIVPLVEPERPFYPPGVAGTGPGYTDGEYPNNLSGETSNSGMANTINALWQARTGNNYPIAATAVGWAGAPIANINKEGGYRPYPASINETAIYASLAAGLGKSYLVGAVTLTHGEADAEIHNTSYGTQVYQMYTDYVSDTHATTGQSRPLVMIASQQSSIPFCAGPTACGPAYLDWGNTGVQLLAQSNAHPTQIIVTGPKYAFQYAQDNLHLQAQGYQRLGEKYGEVFDLVVNQGLLWSPVQPTFLSRTGAVITINYFAPYPPIVFDANIPNPHQSSNTQWSAGHGFTVWDGASPPNPLTISSAVVSGSSVVLTLSATPTNLPVTVNYALDQDAPLNSYNGGTAAGMIGQLRDSDPFIGWDQQTLTVNVTNGFAQVSATSTGQLYNRINYDNVSGSGFPSGTIVTACDNNNLPATLTLSHAWTGASGTAAVTFAHNQYNYAVQSTNVVP